MEHIKFPSIGQFRNVIKEESDTMRDSLIEPKDVNGSISKKAREWYFSQVFT